MKRWTSTTLPWFLSVSLHAGVLFALAHGRAAQSQEERAAVWMGNTFEIETLSQVPTEPAAAAPAVSPSDPAAAAPRPHEEALPEPETPESTDPSEALPSEPPVPDPVARESPTEVEQNSAPAKPAPSATPVEPSKEVVPPAAQPSGNAPPAEEEPSGAAQKPVYGETVARPEAVSLARALTRACPRAAFPDKTWHRLPLGAAGVIEFAVQLDDAGKVVRATRKKNPASPPPKHLLAVVQRTTRMLKSGVFAMATGRVEAGVQRFELSAQIEQQAAVDSVLAEREDLRQIGRFVEPTRTRAGKADFTYNSGRHVILTLRMLGD
jgi:hypothetical protein